MSVDILTKIDKLLMNDNNYYIIDYNIPNSDPSDYNLDEFLTTKIKNSLIIPTNLDSNILIQTPKTFTIIQLKKVISDYKPEIILLIFDLITGKIEYKNIFPKTTGLILDNFKFREKSWFIFLFPIFTSILLYKSY